jgi:predicted nucleic acid-binding protein
VSVVVDASIACKWLVEERDSADAEALLASGAALLAPDLIVAEVCNALWAQVSRGHLPRESAIAAIEQLPGFLSALVPGTEIAARALHIAATLAHPAYDCFYLALAEMRAARLVTADLRLLAAVTGTPWAELVQGLGAATPR